jgi:vacuolar-type H+-ATPase subunit E/Vma4
MPIWGEIELFCRAVSQAGHTEAEQILATARAESEKIVAEVRNQAEREFQEKILAQRGLAAAEAKRLVDAAELEGRKRILKFREQVTQEILEVLEARLEVLTDWPAYPDFLASTIREGIASLPGKAFLVELAKVHLDLVKDQIRLLANELAIEIDLVASPSIRAGALIYTRDRRLLYDNTLLTRLNRRENEIRRKIWRTIFGTETRQG